jgi:hypothetical protein
MGRAILKIRFNIQREISSFFFYKKSVQDAFLIGWKLSQDKSFLSSI